MINDVVWRRGSGVVLAICSVAFGLAAQDPTGGEEPATGEPGGPVEAVAPQEPEAAAPADLGRIAAPDTEIRCFPAEQSPVFADLLAEGDVVQLTGGERDGFVEVGLPLGMLGYVHKDFVQKTPTGTVETTAARVSFRYEPQGGRAPVAQVERGTTFALVGETDDGEWLEVRYAAQTGWVAKDAVVRVVDADALRSAQATWNEALARQRAVVEAAMQKEQERRAALAAREAMAARIDAFNNQLAEAVAEDVSVPAWEALEGAGKELQGEIREQYPDDAELRSAIARAVDSATHAKTMKAAEIFANKDPDIAPRPDLGPKPRKDPLAGATTGWLRFRTPVFGPPRVELEKGGNVLFVLECTSSRYDLQLFDGYEVAVRGAKERPDEESRRVLDVSRLDVIGRGRR